MSQKINRILAVSALAICFATGFWLSEIGQFTENAEAQGFAAIDQNAVLDPFAFESITVSTVAIGFTTATIRPTGAPSARRAECNVESADIRVRYEADPSSTVGHPKASGATFTVYGTNAVRTFRMIRSTGSDATVRCTYFR